MRFVVIRNTFVTALDRLRIVDHLVNVDRRAQAIPLNQHVHQHALKFAAFSQISEFENVEVLSLAFV
jgi:hypothetical protein